MAKGMKQARAVQSTTARAPAEQVYRCAAGHEQPYYSGPLKVTWCREYIGLRTQCGRKARVEEVS